MIKEFKCPKCDSSQTRYRAKTKDRICYMCGNIYVTEEIIEDKKEIGDYKE